MRRVKYLLLLIILFSGIGSSQSFFYLAPGVYKTIGDYSTGKKTDDYTLYLSHNITPSLYGTMNLGKLTAEQDDWTYPQYTAGYHLAYYDFPSTYKIDLGYITGTFNYSPDKSFNYSDRTFLGGIDWFYFYNDMYVGFSQTYLNAKGILTTDSVKEISVHQTNLRFTYIFFPELSITVKPSMHLSSDNKKFFSVYGRINYQASQSLYLKAGGFAGSRIYNFDTDTYALFNLFQTQKNQLFIQADYNFFSNYYLSLGYQFTRFSGYKINYYIAGVNTSFTFY
ncbi:MAG: hypothetical protein HUU54_13485 [Ignavibacteriaceae bacterium]|nr:hypothetical protein [Ignavibacteriaceae bacterium]